MCDVSNNNNNHERDIGYGSLARGCRPARRFQTDFPSVAEARSEFRLCHGTIPSGLGVERFPSNLGCSSRHQDWCHCRLHDIVAMTDLDPGDEPWCFPVASAKAGLAPRVDLVL